MNKNGFTIVELLIVIVVIAILAAMFPVTVNYRWILLGSFFDGLGGSFTANISAYSPRLA